MSNKILYRINFSQSESIYEVYAKKISESDLFGFIVLEDIVFGENTSIVVDPAEERLKLEFNSVKKALIPIHSINRIDEVSKQGMSKLKEKTIESGKISMFPIKGKPKE